MNERIQKLAEQCYETGPIGKDGWPEYSKFNESKFAELILEEVMQELFINGYEDAFDFLNKHFGVEE
jgi:hypothetical protein